MPDSPSLKQSLALHLALVWTLLAIYASLYPFNDWRTTGGDPWLFFTAPWPRYYTAFDLVINTLAYLPLGLLWSVALQRAVPAVAALVLATLLGSGLSAGLEVLQNYLPSRVPSNLDLACNSLGVLSGALAGARWGRRWLDGSRLARLRSALLVSGRGVNTGLILVGLWLLVQFDPATLLFGTGDLRRLLGLPPAQPFSVERFRDFEAAIAASGLLAALLVSGLLMPSRQRRLLPLALVLAALVAKTLAFALMMRPMPALAWATPGSLTGLGMGVVMWLAASRLAPPLQRALAALSLLIATIMVNLGPENPYLEHSLQVWNPGQFLNFHGLTRFAASLWPLLTLPWLMLFAADEEKS